MPNRRPEAVELPERAFPSGAALRSWLRKNHATSTGLWVRIFKKASGVPSVTFEEVLDEGLCFGWSESRAARLHQAQLRASRR